MIVLMLSAVLQVGKDGFWYQYIKELDRQRARGVQAVESPLLWSDEELVDLLQVLVELYLLLAVWVLFVLYCAVLLLH